MERRSFLAILAGGAVGVSGCTSNAPMPSPTETLTEVPLPYSNCVSDVEMVQIRNSDNEVPLRWPKYDWEIQDLEETTSLPKSVMWVVFSSNDREELEYASDLDGIEEVKAFIENTDFSNQTLFLYQSQTGPCETLEVNFVTWQEVERPNGNHHNIAIDREFSKPDGDCDRNSSNNIITTVIRIPEKMEERNRLTAGSITRASDC